MEPNKVHMYSLSCYNECLTKIRLNNWATVTVIITLKLDYRFTESWGYVQGYVYSFGLDCMYD